MLYFVGRCLALDLLWWDLFCLPPSSNCPLGIMNMSIFPRNLGADLVIKHSTI